MKVAVVTAGMRSGERGGAEAFYAGLLGGLRSIGVDADQVDVPIDESTFDTVLASYGRCYDLDLRQYDVVISTKAPTYMLRHPRHISYLVHTLRVFYDRFASEFGDGTANLRRQRALIHALDKSALHPRRVRRHFTIGHTNYRRLIDADSFWSDIHYEVLHPPATVTGFKPPKPGQYFFLPGRLHRWKRADLVIRAMQRLERDIPLKIAGTGEDEQPLRRLAGGDRRIQFLGRVSDEQLVDLFASAVAVPFVPVQEDYGLVMVEAFNSRKPVVTCFDSGEPLHFVTHGVNGLVVEPTADALADALEFFIDRPERAAEMGDNGFRTVSHIRWESIASTLVHSVNGATTSVPATTRTCSLVSSSVDETPAAALSATSPRLGPATAGPSRLNVVVLDMQPIHPACGGGRLRLLGLYHALGAHLPTTYLGTYDWPGPGYRDHQLTATLREIDVPLSHRHFQMADDWRHLAGGKTVIDVSFPLLAHHSPEFVKAARDSVRDADIVVFSHPWVYPLIGDALGRRDPVVIYDAHNVESVLRYRLLADSEIGLRIVRNGTAAERDLCRRADLVLTCSHDDRDLFHRLYEIPFGKCLVMPNGTFVGEPPRESARRDKKRLLGLDDKPLAIFLGSLYPPNEEAADFICTELAPALPDVRFAICGGVGTAVDRASLARRGIANVHVTGVVDDTVRRDYLGAADVAVNPMFSGSGTNIKMFDFMAAGLPVISTPTGARGITQFESALHICAAREFAGALRTVLVDDAYARRLGTTARRLACESYSWERLSPRLGRLLTRHRTARRPRPAFSVVVPTYERHAHLPTLLACLARQTCSDFEVILIDQSAARWDVSDEYSSLDILYEHTDLRGTSRARNLGAWLARGDVLAFTDDDCQPEPDWLKNATRYFKEARVVGVEGLIVSDRVNDPDYRAVTNVGFEGIGFMTANLLLRRDVFNAIDGFDEQFDVPFREDTDLGWRACALGEIPFGHDVRVFHPPHARSIGREAHSARVRFFEKDALLLKKHPDRYKSLFLKEGHYRHTAGFREHFIRGSVKYGVPIDDFYSALLTAPAVDTGATVRG
jgi:glycosyltransferase involved in cell wall biosynthesis/GT2 family glycosyltransferase